MWTTCCHSIEVAWNDSYFIIQYQLLRGTWRCFRLRNSATNQKVAGSILDGAIWIFHWHNPSSRTMALGLTQPLTEMSTRNVWVPVTFPRGGLKQPVCRADNLTTFMWRLSSNLGASNSWNPQGLSRPVMGLLYLLSTAEVIYYQMRYCAMHFYHWWVKSNWSFHISYYVIYLEHVGRYTEVL